MSRSRLIINLSLLALSTLVSLGVAEVALRLISPGPVFSSEFPLYPHRRRVMEFTTSEGHPETIVNSTNRLGFRGDEPPADWAHSLTILTVGGSTTQCYYLDDHQTWPYLLQSRLRRDDPTAWVGNAGLDGHSTRGHIRLMQQVVQPLKPRVVIFLVGVNDLALSLRDDAKSYDLPGDWKWRFFSRSRIGQIFYTWTLILLNRVPPAERIASSYTHTLKTISSPAPLPRDLKTMLPGLGEYAANLRTLIQSARSAGIRPVFLTQPMLFADTPFWRTREGSFSWVAHMQQHLSAADYWRLMKVYNDTLLDVCHDEKAEAYDLAAAVPHAPDYFLDAVHLNARGAETVAERVATYLKGRGL
jgi:lysophospholipase L1-like esterase